MTTNKPVTTGRVVEEVTSVEKTSSTILLVDDEKLARMLTRRRLSNLNYRVLEAANGKEALDLLEREPVDLILSDWMMPVLDGPGLCEVIKQNKKYRMIPFVLMTILDQPERIAEGLSRGADDFLPKASSDREIISRVRAGLRARQLMLDLEKSNEMLSQKQAELHSELRSAADFVKGLLPPVGEVVPGVRLEWQFLPSSHLGGDLFQVTRWGDDHIGLMMLDMSGHGIGAALRAVSLAMFFKGEHIHQTSPTYDPGEIVTFLNHQNPMSDEGEYFTIWVGVWQCSSHMLRFASAGHPASIMVRPSRESKVLGERSWPIGFSSDAVYGTQSVHVQAGDRLYLFSDGIYEVMNLTGELWGRLRLQEALKNLSHQQMEHGLPKVIEESRAWKSGGSFEDDVALLGLEFQ